MKRFLSAFLFLSGILAQAQVFNRAPLEPSRFATFPIGAIRADGWLQEQLYMQAEGLTGLFRSGGTGQCLVGW